MISDGPRENAPVARIEIVGPGAEVFYETEGKAGKSEQDETAWR